METNNVTKKLTEVIQILSEHYDLAFNENNEEIFSVQNKRRAAQQRLRELEDRFTPEVNEAFSDLMGAYSVEYQLMSTYAFIHGLKCGIQFNEWVNVDDEPFFAELIGNKDYLERNEKHSEA